LARVEPADLAIARVASRQEGVISVEQLLALGLTRREIDMRVKRGTLHPLHRGVFAVGHRSLTPRGRLFAAQLALGPQAWLSHGTATRVWGLRDISARWIELSIHADHTPRRKGLTIHRTAALPDPAEVTMRDGLRVSSVPRMFVELSRRSSRGTLEGLITVAVRRQILDHQAMQDALDGRPYHIAIRDIEKDRLKEAKLLTIGISVLRITDRRWKHDRRGVWEDLYALLGLTLR
jgi:hypothetical protein